MLTIAALAQVVADNGGWGHVDGRGGGWMWFWGTLMMLSWVAVIAVVVWIVTRSRATAGSRASRAEEMLDERYARGDLSTDEYRERLDNLR